VKAIDLKISVYFILQDQPKVLERVGKSRDKDVSACYETGVLVEIAHDFVFNELEAVDQPGC